MGKNKKQGGSLQDQLKQAGLVTGKQLRKASKGMHRQEMRVKQGLAVEDDKIAAEQAKASKAAGDRKKNEERDQIAQGRALMAQVKQMVEVNSQRESGDAVYNFTDHNKIKKIYISELNKIIRADTRYTIVPKRLWLGFYFDEDLEIFDHSAVDEIVHAEIQRVGKGILLAELDKKVNQIRTKYMVVPDRWPGLNLR